VTLITALLVTTAKLKCLVPGERIASMFRKILTILGLLAVVSAVLIGIAYRTDIRAPRARVATGSNLINTPCGSIEYADEGTGPVIFAIHGAGGGFDQSLDLARAFLAPGFRVVVPSRFGKAIAQSSRQENAAPPRNVRTINLLIDKANLATV